MHQTTTSPGTRANLCLLTIAVPLPSKCLAHSRCSTLTCPVNDWFTEALLPAHAANPLVGLSLWAGGPSFAVALETDAECVKLSSRVVCANAPTRTCQRRHFEPTSVWLQNLTLLTVFSYILCSSCSGIWGLDPGETAPPRASSFLGIANDPTQGCPRYGNQAIRNPNPTISFI